MGAMIRQRGGLEMLVIYGVLMAAFVAVAVGGWAKFTGVYLDRGRAEVIDRYGPIIAECDKRKLAPAACADSWLAADRDREQAVANLARCQESGRVQSAAVSAAEAASASARATTSKILAEIAKQSDATRAELDRLRRIAATPAATRKDACDEADAVLAALASRRMRFAPSVAPGAGGQGGDGQGADPGAVRIRP